jgi:RecB family exonuclease
MTTRVHVTAYGAPSFDALRAVVADAKADDPMAPVTLLVPGNLAGIAARRHLAHGLGTGRNGIAGVYLSTLPRLAEQLAAPTLTASGRRPATRPVTSATWRKALDDEPGCFDPVQEHPATIRALVGAHTELRDLSDEALHAVAGSTTLAPDLLRLHRRVVEQLSEGWYDTTDLLRTAADLVAEQPERVAEFGSFVLWQPQDLSQAEARLAEMLVKHADLTVVAALTNVDRADSTVLRSLRRLGLEEPTERPERPVATEILNASDADDEVRCVVRDVVRTLRTKPAHRIAVLYSTAEPYARLLHEHLATSGITVNGPGVRAVHERATARCLLGVLALGPTDVPRGDLFRALAEAPARDWTGTRIPVARWERISRGAGVVSGADWQLRLDRYLTAQQREVESQQAGADPSLARIDRAQRNLDAATGLRDFATGLRKRLAQGQELTTWAALSKWAADLFSDLVGDDETLRTLPPEEQYAAAAVKLTLTGLTTLDVTGAPASYATLRDVLNLELEGAVPRVGRFGEGVQVAPLSAAIGLDVDVVYAVGLAEDIYPGRLHPDALLPEEARDASRAELPAARDHLDARQRHLLAAFAAGHRVVASFPRGDLRRSTARLPSQWLLPSLRELCGDKTLPATAWDSVSGPWHTVSSSYAGELLATPHPASEQEWRTKAASAHVDLRDEVVERAREMIRARGGTSLTRFDGNLTGVDGLPDYLATDRVVSPTALESYAECPHAFFVERLLRVERVEDPEELVTISPLDIGNLVHESFDALVKEFAGQLPSYGEPWTPEHRKRLAEIVDAKAKQYEEAGLTGHPRLWQRERVRISADLAWMLDDDNACRQGRATQVLASELTFGMQGQDPVELRLPGGHVLMRGSADKVDEGRDGTLHVIDIKTGSTRKYKGLSEEHPVLDGTRLQLPVYAYAARQRLGASATPVEAEYWFVRKDRGDRVKVPLTPEVETTYAETLETIVRSIAAGLFPQRPPADPDFGWTQCAFCNPDGRGHGEARDRWERKRMDPSLEAYVRVVERDALELDEEVDQ